MDLDDLKRILAQELGVSVGDISDESSSETLPNWDSLTQLRIIARLEAESGLTFGQAEADAYTSVPALHAYLAKKRTTPLRPVRVTPPQQAAGRAGEPEPEFPVLVVGDSLVRMFAYDSRFIPLLALRGRDFNALTEESRSQSQITLDHIAPRVSPGTHVLFARVGDCVHHALNTLGTQDTIKDSLRSRFFADVAEFYIQQIVNFRKQTNTICSVMAVPATPKPGVGQCAALFNTALESLCDHHDLNFIGLPDELLDSRGVVQWAYMADEVHLSHEVLPLLGPNLERAGLISGPAAGPPKPGRYLFRFQAPGGLMSVWGDCPPDELNHQFVWPEFPYAEFEVATKTAAYWHTHHEATHRAFDAMGVISKLVDRLDSSPECPLLVLNAEDGFLAQTLCQASGREVWAVNSDPLSTGRAMVLQRLAGVEKVKTITLQNINSVPQLGPIAAAILYDQPRMAGGYLRLLLNGPLAHVPIVFLRTAVRDIAMATFGEAGFKAAFDVPLYSTHWPDPTTRDHAVVHGGLYEAVHSDSILCATRLAIDPAAAKTIADSFEHVAKIHLNGYAERVANRVSAIRRGLSGSDD